MLMLLSSIPLQWTPELLGEDVHTQLPLLSSKYMSMPVSRPSTKHLELTLGGLSPLHTHYLLLPSQLAEQAGPE